MYTVILRIEEGLDIVSYFVGTFPTFEIARTNITCNLDGEKRLEENSEEELPGWLKSDELLPIKSWFYTWPEYEFLGSYYILKY